MTIYEKTQGGLYKQPERTVATFPSGLVRIDQKYICANASEATHRATLAVGNELPEDDGYPTIDGAYIFPHCQQIRRGDGFTEFIASAYGRTTNQPSNFVTTLKTIAVSPIISYNLFDFTVDIVLPTNESLRLDAINFDPQLLDPFGFFYKNKYNQIRSIQESGTTYFTTISINAEGGLDLGTYSRDRVFTVTFDMYSNAGVPLGTTEVASFAINDPVVKVIAQSNYGKFTEYKIEVVHTNPINTI